MSPAMLDAPPQPLTLTDLALRFGPMPAWRLMTDRPLGEATEDDVDDLQQRTKLLAELVDGVLVRKTMGSFESLIAGEIFGMLRDFVKQQRLGWVLPADGMLCLWPGRVRIPDACFISKEQTPDGKFPRGERIANLYPDLAVEVLSDSNTREEMDEKLRDYFQAGARLVWYLDPRARTADVYTAVDRKVTIPADGHLTGDPVLPGLTISLADLFNVDR
jgi:Uma2 family endonuclease